LTELIHLEDHRPDEDHEAKLVKWDKRFLALSQHVAGWSKDPSTKVGAVIVRPDKTVLSVGYNGFPRNMRDDPEFYRDRDFKLSRVVHAEMNAILNASEPVKGATLYVSLPAYTSDGLPAVPLCDRCVVHVIQAGIKRVVGYLALSNDEAQLRWAEGQQLSASYLEEARVDYRMYNLGE
jgi:dCMP deaminase